MLKAQINELEVEMKDLKERHDNEMKVMKENQAAILQFMAEYKNDNPDKNFSNVLNTTNTQVIIKEFDIFINVWTYNFMFQW